MQQPNDLQNLPDQIIDLLPVFFRHHNSVVFLLNQIKQNVLILEKMSHDENNRSQFQLWEKSIEHLITIRELLKAAIQEFDPEHPHYEELAIFINSNNLDKLDHTIKQLQKNQLSRYPAFLLETKLIHELSNYQASRIPSLKQFYIELNDQANIPALQKDRVQNLQQTIVNYYYHLRKVSGKVEHWLFRKSRETRLANTLEPFINNEILSEHGIKVPHKVHRNDSTINIAKLNKDNQCLSKKQPSH